MNDTSNVLAILYKRVDADDDEELLDDENSEKESDEEDSMRHFILTPLEIVDGYETEVNGHKVFVPKNSNYSKLYMINDPLSIDEKFTYAFPLHVDDYTDSDKRILIRSLKNDRLYNVMLFQNFKKDTTDELETYTIDYLRKENVMFIVDPNNYDETESMLEVDIDALRTNNPHAEKIILRPSKKNTDPQTKEQAEEVNDNTKSNNGNFEIYADALYNEIKKSVCCQDEQVKEIASIITENYLSDTPDLKGNFILCGPTGVGKTLIFEILAKILSLPIVEEDSTEFTAAGYKDRTVTTVLYDLLIAAGGDVEAAQNGIIYFDEIDKKAGNDLEVTKIAVIQALLKMIEGHVYTIHMPNGKDVRFDTSKVTFAFGGAFDGIEKYSNFNGKDIGFGRNSITPRKEDIYNEHTLKHYGLISEFVGRNNIIVMNSFKAAELSKLMRESDIAYLKLYRDFLLKKRNIELIYSDPTIDAIAAKAEKLGEGARGIKKVVTEALKIARYQVLSSNYRQYSQLILTPETIEDSRKFILR